MAVLPQFGGCLTDYFGHSGWGGTISFKGNLFQVWTNMVPSMQGFNNAYKLYQEIFCVEMLK